MPEEVDIHIIPLLSNITWRNSSEVAMETDGKGNISLCFSCTICAFGSIKRMGKSKSIHEIFVIITVPLLLLFSF